LLSIPLAILRDPNGRYLIDDHAITFTPTATTVLSPSKPGARPKTLLAVGDPERTDGADILAGAASESHDIARLYPNATVLTGREATRDEFLHRLPAAEVIHFAGHGVATDTRQAQLLFASDSVTGGVLYANEIAALHLRGTRVAVLAACATADGEQRDREGVLSVARGFLQADVRSVIATLWPINDTSSSRFFVRLHEHLARGEATRYALQKTQIEFAHQRSLPPSTWAAVQNIGY